MARRKKSGGVSCLSIIVLALVAAWVVCNEDLPNRPNLDNAPPPRPPQVDFPGETRLPDRPDIIRIATFNIQVLGESKMSVERDAAILGEILRQFDVVALQELRAANDQEIIRRLLAHVNVQGGGFTALVGPRLGRTTSKEQYVFLYNSRRIELADPPIPPEPYTLEDLDDRLHREPYIARFRVKDVPLEETFTFTLVNIHTDPDEANDEVEYLATVYNQMREKNVEDDIIFLGDFNARERKLSEFFPATAHRVITGKTTTNTRESEQYDNILFDTTATREFTEDYGVYNFRTRFQLDEKAALEISDHFPVWAEFVIREAR